MTGYVLSRPVSKYSYLGHLVHASTLLMELLETCSLLEALPHGSRSKHVKADHISV